MAIRARIRASVQRNLRRGKRKVLWTQSTANLGNFLYDWMHAFNMRSRGLDIVCLRTPATEYWVPHFGGVAEQLLVRPDDVRLTDRREKGLYNEFGVSFDEHDLDSFASGFVAPSGIVDRARVPADCVMTERDVVINVRVGDYHSDPVNRNNYAFDVSDYLRVALGESRRVGGEIERILVVSDGIDWCRERLGWLQEECVQLAFEDAGLPPETHLAILANAPRLVLANSTFSYWGAYLSTWRFGQPEQVVAPWFHIRADLGGAAWQLDPRWTIVRDIPSGWALPPDD